MTAVMTDEELIAWAASTRKASDLAYRHKKLGPFGTQAASRWRQ